jgi:hypothetical protein
MSKQADKMKLSEEILALIELKRAETGDDLLGAEVEAFLIEAQFRELESEILDNPGAFEPWLLRRRRDN